MMACQQRSMMSFTRLSTNAKTPERTSCLDVGYELYSAENETIPAGKRQLIETDISFTFKFGYYGFIVSIPELSEQKSIDVGNKILSCQNGLHPIKVLLINNSDKEFKVVKGDKIAILVANKFHDHYILIDNTKLFECT